MTQYAVLGPVDWDRIWKDLDKLVTPDHYRELKSISQQTQLYNPGYWWGVFQSYQEVIDNAGTIAQRYSRSGVVVNPPGRGITDNPLIKPADMNKAVNKLYQGQLDAAKSIEEESKAYLKANPHLDDSQPLEKRLWSAAKTLPVLGAVPKTLETAANTSEKVVNIAGKGLSAVEKLVDAANNYLDDPPWWSSPGIILAGAGAIGIAILSRAK